MVVLVVGLSQPVLDLSVRVSHQFLTRHRLAVNQSYRLEEGEEDVMFTEVRQTAGVSFSAGGSTNNTLRTASILLAKRGQEGVVGGSGKHKYFFEEYPPMTYFRVSGQYRPG